MEVVPKAEPSDFASRCVRAQQRINEAVTRSGLRGDPYGQVVEALGEALGIVAEIPDQIEMVRQPLDPSATRLLLDRVARGGVGAMERHAAALANVVRTRTIVACFAVASALLVTGLGCGLWLASILAPAPPMAVSGCQPVVALQGGTVATCSFWLKPPTR